MQQNMDTFISLLKRTKLECHLSRTETIQPVPRPPLLFIGGKRNKCHQACRLSLVGFGVIIYSII